MHVRGDDRVRQRHDAADGEVEAARQDDDALPYGGEDERNGGVDDRLALERRQEMVLIRDEEADVHAERPREDREGEQKWGLLHAEVPPA